VERLFRLTGRTFCAGFIVKDGIIVKTAPILSWLLGEELWRAELHASAYGEQLEEI
jgi:hypothetical protein